MKYRIKIPPPVAAVQLDGSPVRSNGEQVRTTMTAFVRERTCDEAFVSLEPNRVFAMDDVLAAARVCAKFEDAVDHVDLEDSDYERLVRATKTPRGGYHPAAARNALVFMRAVVDAQTIEER